MLSLVLAESALEIVPKEIQRHPSVLSHANKLGKKPSEILLDNSWHFAAMKGISNEIKRGRPDLIHFCLLEASSIPLYKENKIRIYIHTINDDVIILGKDVQLPKSYHRFAGVIEKLFKEKTVTSDKTTLLELKKMNFSQLIDMINPKKTIGFSTQGNPSTIQKVASEIEDDTCLIIGGFQKGHFSDLVRKRINQLYKIENGSFEAHVIISRVLYEYEKTIFM